MISLSYLRGARRRARLRQLVLGLAMIAVLCLAWARTRHGYSDEAELRWGSTYGIYTFQGTVILAMSGDPAAPEPLGFTVRRGYRWSNALFLWSTVHRHGHVALGFGAVARDGISQGDPDTKAVMIPLWSLVALTGAWLIWCMRRRPAGGGVASLVP